MQMRLLMLIIFIQVVFTTSHEIFTRSQLRGLHQRHMIKMLDDEIQQIVERVVATAQNNETSYIYRYVLPSENKYNPYIFNKFEDKTILDRLQNNLVDCNITISEPKCCNPDINFRKRPDIIDDMCKFIHILW